MEYKTVSHEFGPEFSADSRILILGSLPSVRSRECGFYYGHPRNRFWKVISTLYGMPEPESVEEKRSLVRECHIALWDVIARCDIKGSSDASIKNVVPNDVSVILGTARIERIFLNGAAAKRYFDKYCSVGEDIPVTALPSTSPANAAWSLSRLVGAWSVIL